MNFAADVTHIKAATYCWKWRITLCLHCHHLTSGALYTTRAINVSRLSHPEHRTRLAL